jgi:hypothetical protein
VHLARARTAARNRAVSFALRVRKVAWMENELGQG